MSSKPDQVVWIAERTYVYPQDGNEIRLAIRLGEPVHCPADGGFACVVSITDGRDDVERRMCGVDRFAALFCAIVFIGIELGLRIQGPPDEVRWQDGTQSGVSYPIGPDFSLAAAIFPPEV